MIKPLELSLENFAVYKYFFDHLKKIILSHTQSLMILE
jgi:hypothetical protein